MGCSSSRKSAPVSPDPFTGVTPTKEAPQQDFHEKYILGVKLGRGAFAQVRVVKEASSGDSDTPKQESAVKIIDLRDKDSPEECSPSLLKTAKREGAIWRAIGGNRNCVILYDLFLGDYFCYMVMEKCTSGLLQALESMPDLTERGLGNIFAQMLLGISHCHSVKVVHRDIKPDNFLVGGTDSQTIKLGDFGLSAMLPQQGLLPGVFGTAPFMCPEMLKGQSYDEKADIWSFAVVVYVLLFGTFPYMPRQQSSKHMKQAIVEAAVPPSFEAVQRTNSRDKVAKPNALKRSSDALHFAKTLLNRNPTERPSAEKALSMPWMTAAMRACHCPGEDLPSLRPTLHAARKVGAFELRDNTTHTASDKILHSLQMQRQGVPLPSGPSARELVKTAQNQMKERQQQVAKEKELRGSQSKDSSNQSPTRRVSGDSRDDESSVASDSMSVFSGSIFSGWSKSTDPSQARDQSIPTA